MTEPNRIQCPKCKKIMLLGEEHDCITDNESKERRDERPFYDADIIIWDNRLWKKEYKKYVDESEIQEKTGSNFNESRSYHFITEEESKLLEKKIVGENENPFPNARALFIHTGAISWHPIVLSSLKKFGIPTFGITGSDTPDVQGTFKNSTDLKYSQRHFNIAFNRDLFFKKYFKIFLEFSQKVESSSSETANEQWNEFFENFFIKHAQDSGDEIEKGGEETHYEDVKLVGTNLRKRQYYLSGVSSVSSELGMMVRRQVEEYNMKEAVDEARQSLGNFDDKVIEQVLLQINYRNRKKEFGQIDKCLGSLVEAVKFSQLIRDKMSARELVSNGKDFAVARFGRELPLQTSESENWLTDPTNNFGKIIEKFYEVLKRRAGNEEGSKQFVANSVTEVASHLAPILRNFGIKYLLHTSEAYPSIPRALSGRFKGAYPGIPYKDDPEEKIALAEVDGNSSNSIIDAFKEIKKYLSQAGEGDDKINVAVVLDRVSHYGECMSESDFSRLVSDLKKFGAIVIVDNAQGAGRLPPIGNADVVLETTGKAVGAGGALNGSLGVCYLSANFNEKLNTQGSVDSEVDSHNSGTIPVMPLIKAVERLGNEDVIVTTKLLWQQVERKMIQELNDMPGECAELFRMVSESDDVKEEMISAIISRSKFNWDDFKTATGYSGDFDYIVDKIMLKDSTLLRLIKKNHLSEKSNYKDAGYDSYDDFLKEFLERMSMELYNLLRERQGQLYLDREIYHQTLGDVFMVTLHDFLGPENQIDLLSPHNPRDTQVGIFSIRFPELEKEVDKLSSNKKRQMLKDLGYDGNLKVSENLNVLLANRLVERNLKADGYHVGLKEDHKSQVIRIDVHFTQTPEDVYNFAKKLVSTLDTIKQSL